MNQKTKEIAEFDGWKLSDVQPMFGKRVLYTKDNFTAYLDSINYLTDLNALHQVALDVIHKVSSVNMIHKIHHAMLSRPINGEYTDLHDVVYDAIVYLKQHEPCQPK